MGSTIEPAPRDMNAELEFPSATGYHYRPDTYAPRPVWVRLDALLLRDPEMPQHANDAGVEMRGETAGTLTHWIPTVDGDWLGRVTYTLRYAHSIVRAVLEASGRYPFSVRTATLVAADPASEA
ncbi:hypothetical protein [Nocardia sp. NPDC047038]|uniref:hypothetical protein n=1 Tax=Nocardia sp. NPDC047038 TaxID=3154338 RepID=UPI0033F4863A